MALTEQERTLARTATYFGSYVGNLAEGWSPEGLVALSRQARPMLMDTYTFTFLTWDTNGHLTGGTDADIWQQALIDVREWLGYATLDDYDKAIKTLGRSIIARGIDDEHAEDNFE